ncbi:hypothetical protein CERZMDRAFT_95537 [Cercospora zeae-maydis SCOH1-5]|uniref:Uncharacterized protein n=1 Tax=Cercospora zeae-maydis SCOH1-5 TaxID=717836 RepID=A0A6A6FLK6_9PEZI|nr:hypothetical protein CERZMDRAFT_95537 [Cercospora zeae-maydis SCOH1-5]
MPMSDLEAAAAKCSNDHSPSASREERRKTLHIVSEDVHTSPRGRRGQKLQTKHQLPSGGHQLRHTPPIPEEDHALSSSASASSSAAWTGDDVFLLPRLAAESNITSPCRFRVQQQQQQRKHGRAPPQAPVQRHQPSSAPRCPVGSTCSRSALPLRQRADSAVQSINVETMSRCKNTGVKPAGFNCTDPCSGSITLEYTS